MTTTDDWQLFKTRSILHVSTVSNQYKKQGAKQVSSTACHWGKAVASMYKPMFSFGKAGLI